MLNELRALEVKMGLVFTLVSVMSLYSRIGHILTMHLSSSKRLYGQS